MLSNTTLPYFFRSKVKYFGQSPNFETYACSAENLPNSTSHFPNQKSVFLQILHHSSVSWTITPLYFFGLNVRLCIAGTSESTNFSKISQIWPECSVQNLLNSCHFWKRKPVFFSSFSSLFSVMRYHFSWNFIYFKQMEPIKVQIWWNFKWTIKSMEFGNFMGSFCPNDIKVHLKDYRRIGETYNLWFQKWHEKSGKLLLEHSKVETIVLWWALFAQSI